MSNKYPEVFAAWTKNEELRFHSTSGGIFSELSYEVLNHGGFVCGARYNVDNEVEHYIVSDRKGIDLLRQSKYTQSSMRNMYKKVKELLKKKELVAFSGAPCQVAGLKSFLGKKYDNLITFDFICRGVNSPKAYRCWLDEIEKDESSKITNVWFKYKVGGWKTSPKRTKITFEDGHEKIYDHKDNLFMEGYLGPNLYIRKSCGNCRFKGVVRNSDVTLADFWGIDPALDDDHGTSLVLINTEKGEKLWNMIRSKLEVYEQEFSAILAQNPMFNLSANINSKSSEFLKEINKDNFSELVKKYTTIPFSQRIRRKVINHLPKALKRIVKNNHNNIEICDVQQIMTALNDERNYVENGAPILYKKKEDCCGCTACFAICPKGAITMTVDEEGFEYPTIDAKECIKCWQCVKVCPIKIKDRATDGNN